MQTVKLIWIVMVEMHDAMMELESLRVLLLVEVEVVVPQVLQNVEFVRCKNQLKDSIISLNFFLLIILPVGTAVHDTSKLPIPALSNCTFSGSPGQAVSKHHKSLQQTYSKQEIRISIKRMNLT